MSFEAVLAPGQSVDVTVSEILFDGQTLPAAVEEWDWSRKTEEEITYFQGSDLPVERTRGQQSFEVNMTWGGRQWELFKALFGGWSGTTSQPGIAGKEFNMTINCRPKNDTKIYTFNLTRLRFLDEQGKIGKEAFKQPLRWSVMNIESAPVDASPT